MLKIETEDNQEGRSPSAVRGRMLSLVAPQRAARDQSPATQAQRRGIGLWISIFGFVLEWLVAWLSTSVTVAAYWTLSPNVGLFNEFSIRAVFALLNEPDIRGVIAVNAIATALLVAPTHRNGRALCRPSEALASIFARAALAPMLTLAAAMVFNPSSNTVISAGLWSLIAIVNSIAVVLSRAVVFALNHRVRKLGYDLDDVLIVGAGETGQTIATALFDNPDAGLLPIGYVDRYNERLDLPLVGRPEDLHQIVDSMNVRHVILAFGAAPEAELVEYVRECSFLPVQFYTIPRFFELGVSESRGLEIDGYALIPLGRPGHHHLLWPLKRVFDIVVASLLLVLTAPLFAMCAALVRLTSPGPIFFRQERVSVDNVPFEMLKFRTMRYVADPDEQAQLDQQAQAVNLDDQRITTIGKFLRTSHLDELPQLLNVLRGEMAIVGPRPERPYWVEQHTNEFNAYSYRHRVPAGITGWAQVNGFWGDTSLETRTRLDNRYIENWSLWRDLVIGLRTIPTLLGRRR